MAKRFFITKDLDVLEFESVNEWGYPKHKHNFFELTFILHGTGQHTLNESTIYYKKGDVFFLTPKDEHEFVIATPTKFGILKFTEQLFLEKANLASSTHWRKNLDTVIFYANIIPESIIAYDADREQLFNLYGLIKNEIENSFVYGRSVLIELFGALLIIISRNLKSSLKENPKSVTSEKEKIDSILTYIRQNVLDKDRIKIKAIADEFFMSSNYVSIFIKKHAGISIKQYVIQTKINMAERLLKQTDLTISEIAKKTGFVDSSHFNKIFKKYSGINPSEYL
jgi:YesN/AraC family two-component response regulator